MCNTPTIWVSPLHDCDACGQPFGTEEGTTMFDARLPIFRGAWGNWCQTCFDNGGGRLGTGFGQRYALTNLTTGGRAWVLTHGWSN